MTKSKLPAPPAAPVFDDPQIIENWSPNPTTTVVRSGIRRVVGNDAYLLYLNHQHGYDLSSMRKTLDDKDRRIADLEAQVAERDKRIETIIEYERQKEGRR